MTDDGEGSVFVEGFDDDVPEDATEESQDSTVEQADTTTSDNTEGEEQKTETTNTNDQESKDDKTELTEKGTKLDPNPLSRVNQELANERAKIREYEKILNDPILLKNYVAEFGASPEKTETADKVVPEKEMRYEDVKTTEDLQVYLKQQDQKLNAKLKELDTTITGVKTSEKDKAVGTTINSDIAAVRSEYPALDPKSDTYNPELDAAVGKMYERMDFDKSTKKFRGNVRITEIAEIIMAAAGSSKKQGSEEAQTVIKDKRTGKVNAGSASQTIDTSNMSIGQIIAARAKAASRR